MALAFTSHDAVVQMTIDELSSHCLDYAVAVSNGNKDIVVNPHGRIHGVWLGVEYGFLTKFSPSKYPIMGYREIEQRRPKIEWLSKDECCVTLYNDSKPWPVTIATGSTLLEAFFRCVLKEKHGADAKFEIPKTLVDLVNKVK